MRQMRKCLKNYFVMLQVTEKVHHCIQSSSSSCESANFNKLKTPALGCVCMVSSVLGFANISNSAVKLKGGAPPAPQG